MKQKRILTTFECDFCKKRSYESEEPPEYPYNFGWIYIYNLNFKTCNDKINNLKDLHFCCRDCFIKYIIEILR